MPTDSQINRYLVLLAEEAHLQGKELFLVGGAVRDLQLGIPSTDLDFTGERAIPTATGFSKKISRPLVPLDDTPQRRTYRVILDNDLTFDFTELQGETLQEDLAQRDFTINAMALSLDNLLSRQYQYIDPHKGRDDLTRGIVRKLTGPVLLNDPLRMLRAFRLSATLNFSIDPATRDEIRKHSQHLESVAAERIVRELKLILNESATAEIMADLVESRTLFHAFPELREIIPSRDNESGHLRIYSELEEILRSPVRDELALPDEQVALTKLAVFFVSISEGASPNRPEDAATPPAIENVLRAHRFGNREIRCLLNILNVQKRALPGNNATGYLGFTPSDRYHFVKEGNGELAAGLLLGSAIVSAFYGKDQAREFLSKARDIHKFYLERYLPVMQQSSLLNGNDLISCFRLTPSPLFKKVLSSIEEARVLGDISTREEAKALAQEIINNDPTPGTHT